MPKKPTQPAKSPLPPPLKAREDPPPPSEADAEAAEPPPPPPSDSPLSADALALVEAGATTAERAERLRAALGERRYASSARARVRADLLFGVLRFAADDARLPTRKALRLLALADELLAVTTAASAASEPLERVYAVLAERLRAAAEDADAGARFSVAEVARAAAFLSSAVLRHLRALQRVAAGARRSEAALAPLAVETPLPPPPLADAVN